ncbi:hypothetical protein CFP56_007355, partial [Quercus suber]
YHEKALVGKGTISRKLTPSPPDKLKLTSEEEEIIEIAVERRVMRVSISVSKPLRRGCFVPDFDNNRTWLNFKYERLAMFCYFCGFVRHDLKHCADFFAAEKNGASMDLSYWDWLKAMGMAENIKG